jgi:membrane-associated PAP2 superfamily phosphatase
MTPAAFWWRHARAPLLWFLLAISLTAVLNTDRGVAHVLFYDTVRRHWVGAASWWTNEFLHTGGRWGIRCLAAVSLAVWIAASMDERLRPLRRPAAYFVISFALSIGTVGLLKTLTNVDCPWDLREFGGSYPYVSLFGDRPDMLRHAKCFPAAHASSGYALFALYFLVRERSRQWARLGIAVALLVGAAFGLAQQSRGAHFVSHDVWSAFLVWMISLTIYAFVFRARLWNVAAYPVPSLAVPSLPSTPAASPGLELFPVSMAAPVVVLHADRNSGSRGPARPTGQ